MRILQQGAEAVIYQERNRVIKDRIKKNYRLKEIDEKLRNFRTKREAKLLERVDINAPRILKLDLDNKKIEMEFINGKLLKDCLDNLKNRNEICRQIGEEIAQLHDKDIIHGDITTSNLILKDGKVYFIDFGLGFFSKKFEDKAVDLHLLKQALESKHYKHFKESFENVLKGYKSSRNYREVVERLKKVESRGRYKRKNG